MIKQRIYIVSGTVLLLVAIIFVLSCSEALDIFFAAPVKPESYYDKLEEEGWGTNTNALQSGYSSAAEYTFSGYTIERIVINGDDMWICSSMPGGSIERRTINDLDTMITNMSFDANYPWYAFNHYIYTYNYSSGILYKYSGDDFSFQSSNDYVDISLKGIMTANHETIVISKDESGNLITETFKEADLTHLNSYDFGYYNYYPSITALAITPNVDYIYVSTCLDGGAHE
ncbi:hypothetical protein ACFL6D_04820 [Spirochaetota bacterium]